MKLANSQRRSALAVQNMSATPFQVSACRHCRYYTPEGRRGGYCGQFDAVVRAGWKACPLAMPAFAPSWESLERLVHSPAETGVAIVSTVEFKNEAALTATTPVLRSNASASIA
ncbi:MAG: hypothetical protein BJG00_008220 [Limnothrix sp. CACIAM 69d]|nr:MAG: hypothetical protein BJG00_008220 [Limnothrix sp. CACIAM 69d]